MLKEIPENDVPEKMTIDLVTWHLNNVIGFSTSEPPCMVEIDAMREAVKIIAKCEKYRKALKEIDDAVECEIPHWISCVVMRAFDCEEA